MQRRVGVWHLVADAGGDIRSLEPFLGREPRDLDDLSLTLPERVLFGGTWQLLRDFEIVDGTVELTSTFGKLV